LIGAAEGQIIPLGKERMNGAAYNPRNTEEANLASTHLTV